MRTNDLARILVWAVLAAIGVWVSRRANARRRSRAEPLMRVPAGSVPFEKQIADLGACGILLSPGVAPESLFDSFDREAFESEPYRLLLCAMGGEAETEAQAGLTGHPSDNIWHFDTECIENAGDYAAIARRMRELAQGDLPLEDVSDRVDVEAGRASLTFRLSGREYRWDAKVDADWVDSTILSRFAELLRAGKTTRRFTYVDLGGQDCLIGCATAEDRAKLEGVIGRKVAWLS